MVSILDVVVADRGCIILILVESDLKCCYSEYHYHTLMKVRFIVDSSSIIWHSSEKLHFGLIHVDSVM